MKYWINVVVISFFIKLLRIKRLLAYNG